MRHGNRLVARAGLGLTLAVLLALAAALASDLHKPARADPLAQPCGEAGCESAASPIAPLKSQAPGRAGGTPGNFDFYVLALSWSPSFCEAADPERAGAQCEPGAGLGFVVHGLWPQDEYGFPTNCRPAARFPSRMALETAKRIYPSERLARHEWQRHGTCSGKSPTDYFADVRRARDAIAVPPQFAAANEKQTWAPIDILRAFIASNPRLRPGMLGVVCNGSELREVRICFTKDLREFRACPEIARGACRTREVSVPPAL